MNRREFAGGSLAAFLSASMPAGMPGQLSQSGREGGNPTVKAGAGAWMLQNGLVSKHLWWDNVQLRGLVDLPGPAVETHARSGEIYVLLGEEPWPGAQGILKLAAARPEQSEDAASLELIFTSSASPLEVTMRYICRRGDPAIETTCRVRNTGTHPVGNLRRADSCVLVIPSRTASPVIAHWVEGLHDDRKLVEENYRTYRVSQRALQPEDGLDFDSGRWSSNEKLPAIMLEVDGKTYFAGLGWSGEWNMNVTRGSGFLHIQAGVADTVFSLRPGESVESPASFYGVVPGGTENAWNAMHEHCQKAIMPAVPDDFPWVTYNTWYNFGAELREADMREEAGRAAQLGVEVFYIDDGWFEGSAAKGPWGRGAGYWVENHEKFPSGLAAFSEFVRDHGMKFGLWVEPERIDARFVGKPGCAAQSSLATVQGQLVRWGFSDSTSEAQAYQVCFGDAAARETAIESLSRMVRDYKVDWIKWDHNRYEVCQDSSHGHTPRDGDWAHTQGVYAVMDALRSRFPHLILENCAAGGHRFDFGMMRHTHVTWTSDQTSPAFLSRRHVFGAGHPFPPQYLTTWYVDDERVPDVGTMSKAQVDTLFRSHMMGAFGLSAKLGSWPKSMAAAARRNIAMYKRVRPCFRGRMAWLTPQATVCSPRMQPGSDWEAIEMWRPDGSEGVAFVFRSISSQPQWVLRSRTVDAAKRYEVRDEDSRMPVQSIMGATLRSRGLEISLPETQTSAVIWMRAV